MDQQTREAVLIVKVTAELGQTCGADVAVWCCVYVVCVCVCTPAGDADNHAVLVLLVAEERQRRGLA